MKVQIEQPYAPRRVATVEPIHSDTWQLKTYWMSVDGSDPDPALLGLAGEHVLSMLGDEDGYGVGFVIVHRGKVADWIVLGWWTDEDILRRRVLSHEKGAIVDRSAEHFLACVWELSVIDWERKAWINTVLRRPDDADVAQYLAALYPSDFC